MSAGNHFETERKAFDLRTKAITTSATTTTYTAKTGRTADGFVLDRVIQVTTTDGNSMTITVKDGVYAGQQLLVVFKSEANAETVNATTDTGDNLTQLSQTGAWGILLWIDDTNGWVEMAKGT